MIMKVSYILYGSTFVIDHANYMKEIISIFGILSIIISSFYTLIEKDIIKVKAPKRKVRTTEKPEKGIAIIGPETLVEIKHPSVTVDKILNKDLDFFDYKEYCVCPNGALYRKDIRGFLPELMDQMYKDRKMFKNKMIDAKKNLEDINAELKRRGLTK